MKKRSRNVLSIIVMDILETAVITITVFALVYLLAFQPTLIDGVSMTTKAGGFDHGQRIITDLLVYRFREPQRGEVIIFHPPNSKKDDLIKRVIALPNEKIKIENNTITIYNDDNPNGFILDESSYLDQDIVTTASTSSISPTREGKIVEVPENHFFVMGDNRQNSSDSRSFGFVSYEEIVGKGSVRYWPIEDINLLQAPQY